MKFPAILLLTLLPTPALADPPITRIWLTHASHFGDVTVNWETDAPSDSSVEFGQSKELGARVEDPAKVTLHHVEIPADTAKPSWFYRVRSGTQASEVRRVKGYADEVARIAIVADTGYMKRDWGDVVLKDDPHLLLSAGDNVGDLHSSGEEKSGRATAAFSKLIDRFPNLYATTPFLPALGNHDREIHARGDKPPAEAVYDVDAMAFRSFFPLPKPEWTWHFDLPVFGARFIALDMSHLSDQGTTWQTCHSPKAEGEQFKWYQELMKQSDQPYVFTIFNEKSSTVRGLEKGQWNQLISKGSAAITGFGYFAERAEVEGFPWYNTSVSGTGAKYADPKSALFKSDDNYILITLSRNKEALVEMKNLDGQVIDSRSFKARKK